MDNPRNGEYSGTDRQGVTVFYLILFVVRVILLPLSATKKDVLLWTLTVKKENAILHRSLKSRRKRAKFNFADKVFYAIVKMLRQHTTDKPRPTPHTTTRVHSRTSFFVADNGNRNEHPHANTSNKNSPPHPTHANTKTTTHNETTDTTNEE